MESHGAVTNRLGVSAKVRAGAGRPVGSVRAWCGLGLMLLARAYRGFLLTLIAAAMIPGLWNWTSYVVRSGSMEPVISIGDVVVANPLSADDRVPVGRVMVFTDPAAVDRTLLHRVVENLGDGSFTSAGDANESIDSTPVPRDNFVARATICVPFVGLPLVWLDDRDLFALLVWIVLTGAAFYISSQPTGTPRGRRTTKAKTAVGSGSLAGGVVRVAVRTVPLALVVTAVGIGATVPPSAVAAFRSITKNPSSTWSVAPPVAQPYTTQVLADNPYIYYLVDEASGSSMADRSGNGRTGTYASIASYHQPGGLPGNFGYSVGLNGSSGRMISGGTALNDPNTFTLELWFKTTTSAGGKLIGLESTRNATSPSFDRHVFMRPDGRVVYGGWPNGGTTTLTSPKALNNGSWHHLALTARPRGSQQDSVLYIDGVNVAAGRTTKTSSYSGWWRIGYGSLPTGTGYPASANFAGTIDNIVIYRSELNAGRVAAHYAAR